MDSFKKYITVSEETMPHQTARGTRDLDDDATIDNINVVLNGITSLRFPNPYIALEKVKKALANWHIFLSRTPYMEHDHGVEVWPINQFGGKAGMTDAGEFKVGDPSGYYLFFENGLDDNGTFLTYCEVVNQDDLEQLKNEVNAEEEPLAEMEMISRTPETDAYYLEQQRKRRALGEETQLDELSGGTLAKYKRAAERDKEALQKIMMKGKDGYKKYDRADNRQRGIDRAEKRLSGSIRARRSKDAKSKDKYEYSMGSGKKALKLKKHDDKPTRNEKILNRVNREDNKKRKAEWKAGEKARKAQMAWEKLPMSQRLRENWKSANSFWDSKAGEKAQKKAREYKKALGNKMPNLSDDEFEKLKKANRKRYDDKRHPADKR